MLKNIPHAKTKVKPFGEISRQPTWRLCSPPRDTGSNKTNVSAPMTLLVPTRGSGFRGSPILSLRDPLAICFSFLKNNRASILLFGKCQPRFLFIGQCPLQENRWRSSSLLFLCHKLLYLPFCFTIRRLQRLFSPQWVVPYLYVLLWTSIRILSQGLAAPGSWDWSTCTSPPNRVPGTYPGRRLSRIRDT